MRVGSLVLTGLLSISLLGGGSVALGQQSPEDQKAQQKQLEEQAKVREKQAKAQENAAKAQEKAAKAQQKAIEAQQKAAAAQAGQTKDDHSH